MSHITHPSYSCNRVPKASRGLSSSSPADLLAFVTCCALFAISLCALFAAPKALAATWPVSVSALSASVSFHESYSAGNESYVHSGIDIPASAGMQISAPMAGAVRFTGAVPSGDSRVGGNASAKTMRAVTIEIQNGHTITLMPFDAIQVSAGQFVDEGARLGTLAASGDPSSLVTHLHMGYKEGRRYLDPMQLFGLLSSSTPDRAAAFSSAPSVPGTTTAPSLSATASELALQGEAPLASTSPEPAPSFGLIETGDYVLEPKPYLAKSPLTTIIDPMLPFVSACEGQLASLMEALSVAAQAISVPFPVLAGGIALFVLSALGASVTVIVKKLVPRQKQTLQPRRCKAVKQLG